MMAARQAQRGLSFLSMLFVLAVLAGLGVMGARALPSFLEYQAVLRAVDQASAAATPQEVRASFDRSAQVDNITALSGRDLQVAAEGDRHVVSFAYQKEFHMAGPAWLTLKYAGSSGRR